MLISTVAASPSLFPFEKAQNQQHPGAHRSRESAQVEVDAGLPVMDIADQIDGYDHMRAGQGAGQVYVVK